MNVKHPFEWIEKASRFRVFVLWFIVTVVVIVGMQVLGKPLISKAAPAGIVSFEFAGNMENALEILASWRHEVRVFAGLNLGFDYVFMFAYGGTIGLGCVLVASRWQEKLSMLTSIGCLLAWGSILAAVFDAVENYALIRILIGSFNEIWPVVAMWCAGVKFFLVGIGLLYIVGSTILQSFSKYKQ